MKIWEDQLIEKNQTIVVIGPNGSGKTKYGIKLSQLNNADHIGALRNIALQENLPMMSLPQAENEVKNQLSRRRSHYWELSNEIDILFSKLMADDSASAIRFRDLFASGQTADIEKTKIMEIKQLWETLFPARKIRFDGYVPKVDSEYMASNGYAARFMSDGERVALYLAGRVLDSVSEIIIIDEPEVHFHSKLAVRFWNSLEALRPSKRFVYITHSLEFALSRNNPIFLIVRPNQKPQIIENIVDIPKEVTTDLLAGASLSIFAKRVVFCEGDRENSKDNLLLTTWFENKDTVVVPLNSCKNVIQVVISYHKTDIIQNLSVVGIVDQDYSSARAIDAIKDDLFILQFHEIESLILHESIILAVLAELGLDEEKQKNIITQIKERASTVFSNEIINHTISERYKKELEFQVTFKIRGLKSNIDDSLQKKDHLEIINNISGTMTSIYDISEREVKEALSKSYLEILRVLPGKPLSSLIYSLIGVKPETYLNIVCKLIRRNQPQVIDCLCKYLPDREIKKNSA